MTSSVAERVRECWRASGVGARAGLTAEGISRFEALHGLSLPDAVAGFYTAVNGMEVDGLDEEVFVAFPLADVQPVPEAIGNYRGIPDYGSIVERLRDAGDYFVFGECMIWSQVLAVRLRGPTSDMPVIWISGSTFIRVATSFEDFWERYLKDPSAVVGATRQLLGGAV